MFSSRLRDRRGATLVLMTLCCIPLLAMAALVVDVGRLCVARQKAQNVADAAALAAMRKLDGTPACEDLACMAAREIGLANNMRSPYWIVEPVRSGDDTVTVTFPKGNIQATDGRVIQVKDGQAVRVECRSPVTYGFGRIFGSLSGSGRAAAVAVRKKTDYLTLKLAPWCVSDTSLWSQDPVTGALQPKVVIGQQMPLKITNPSNPGSFIGPGNFLAVAYNGSTGAGAYEDNLAGAGLVVTITVGLTLSELNVVTQPGNIAGPTKKAIDRRATGDTWTFDAWKLQGEQTGRYPGSLRVVVLPIIADPAQPLGGRKPLDVAGFAAFFVETYDEKTTTVYGRFVSAIDKAGRLLWGLDYSGADTSLVTTIGLVN